MTAQTAPAKETLNLFEFRYGKRSAPLFYRATDDTRDVWLGTDVYTSVPAIETQLPEQGGGVTEEPAEVRLPITSGSFAEAISGMSPHSDIWLVIRSVKRATAALEGASVEIPFVGKVTTRHRHPDGRAGILQLLVSSPKTLLATPLGIAANYTCWWGLGQGGCKADVASGLLTPTVSSITGTTIVLDDGGGSGGPLRGKATGYWKDGWIERAGLRIKVKDWQGTGTGTFVLTRRPPTEWLSQTVTIAPGCSQLWTVCDTRHGQLEQFMGIGAGMPSRNPLFEVT